MPTKSLSQLTSANSVAREDLIELSVYAAPSSYESNNITFDNFEKSLDVYNTVLANSASWIKTVQTPIDTSDYQTWKRNVYSISSSPYSMTYDYTSGPKINNSIYVVTTSGVAIGNTVIVKLPYTGNILGFMATITKCLTGSASWPIIKLQVGEGTTGLVGNGKIIRASDQAENYTNITVQCISLNPVVYTVIGGHGTWTNADV